MTQPVPPHRTADGLTQSPSNVQTALLAGLMPTMPSVKALCRITNVVAITHASPDPAEDLQSIVNAKVAKSSSAGWIILLGYELGRAIEPKATANNARPPLPPIIALRWEGAWITGNSTPQWIGDPRWTFPLHADPPAPNTFTVQNPVSSMGRQAYIDRIKQTQKYIEAGDIYQANIAHHIRAQFTGCPQAAARALLDAANPAFGSVLTFKHNASEHRIISVSPELFLSFDPESRTLTTRPMKGTRPAHADPSELRDAAKDRAELNMIVDLMRNDLGRVCDFGSVHVTQERAIEHHGSGDGGVLQATATVQGRLRDSCALGDVLRACFPPGSVTGVPKIRAMQIIEELEATPRGPYCGSILVLNDAGAFVSSVGIRTAHLHQGVLSYAVGAGIVADSVPEDEWEETMTKAAILQTALGLDLSNL